MDLAGRPESAALESGLSARLHAYFSSHADADFDLWSGGRAKSNITNPAYWQAAWGPEWHCVT